MTTKTPEQVKKELRSKGIPVSAWATKHGYTPQEVYKVLNGQAKGNFGKAHDIAIALGIKSQKVTA